MHLLPPGNWLSTGFVYLTVCLAILPLGACSSMNEYDDLGPNFYVRDKDEIELQKQKFELADSPLVPGYKLGGKRFETKSLFPVISSVSEEAAQKLAAGTSNRYMGLILVGLGMFGVLSPYQGSGCLECWGGATAIGGLGLLAYGNSQVNAAIRLYNRTLLERLTAGERSSNWNPPHPTTPLVQIELVY